MEFSPPCSFDTLCDFFLKHNSQLLGFSLRKTAHDEYTLEMNNDNYIRYRNNRKFRISFQCGICKKLDCNLSSEIIFKNFAEKKEIYCKGCSHGIALTQITMQDFVAKANEHKFKFIDDINKRYNKKTKYKVMCVNSHITEKTFANLKYNCSVCNNQSMALTPVEIINDIQRSNIFIVDHIVEYTNRIESKIEVKCLKCGLEYADCYDNLYNHTTGCKYCYKFGKESYTLEERNEIAKQNECVLLSQDYINQDTVLVFICKCEAIFHKSFKNFINHPRCEACSSLKREETNLVVHGVRNVGQSEACKEKGIQTNLERRGVKYASQDPEFKKKVKETNLRNHNGIWNFRHPEIMKKNYETCLALFGTKTSVHSAKFKKTMIERYGKEHIMQNSEHFSRSKRYTKKEYTFSNGRVVKVQGYEHFALADLEKMFEIDDIQVCSDKNLSIEYIDGEGNARVYHPDLYVKSINTYIEVKSPYTLLSDYETNLCKWKTTAEICPIFVWVYDGKGKRVETIEFKENGDFELYLEKNMLQNINRIEKKGNCKLVTELEYISSETQCAIFCCEYGHNFICNLISDPRCGTCDATISLAIRFLNKKLILASESSSLDRKIKHLCICQACNGNQEVTLGDIEHCKKESACKLCDGNGVPYTSTRRAHLDTIKQQFLDKGWIFLSDKYENNKTAYECECTECHEKKSITYQNIQRNSKFGCCKKKQN